jgi:UDP-N-acetylglucosamine transferase subunit ALG13
LVGSGRIKEDVFGQIGMGSYKPANIEVVEFMSPDEFSRVVKRCDVVVSHAGVGTIGTVLRYSKPLVAMPRKAGLGEISNDHQFTTARQFELEGKILVASGEAELADKIEEASNFRPALSDDIAGIKACVREFIESCVSLEKR